MQILGNGKKRAKKNDYFAVKFKRKAMQVKAIIPTTTVQGVIDQRLVIGVVTASQGPAGPPGADGSAPQIQGLALENLSAGRAVIMEGGAFKYFQPSDPLHLGRVVGITISSATTGSQVTVQTGGIVTDASFTFDPDTPIFVTADGELSSSPPTSGTIHLVGLSLAGDQILLNINFSIIQN